MEGMVAKFPEIVVTGELDDIPMKVLFAYPIESPVKGAD